MSLIKKNFEKTCSLFSDAKIGIALYDIKNNLFKVANEIFIKTFEIEGDIKKILLNELFPSKYYDSLLISNTIDISNINCISFEMNYAKKNGTNILCIVYLSKISGTDELFIHVINFNNTKCQRQELLALSENLPGFAYKYQLSKDGTEKFLYASKRVIDIYGVSSKVALNDISKIREVIHPDDIKSFKKSIEKSAETLEVFHHEFRVLHPQKGEIYVETKSIPEKKYSDGSIIWRGITLDITERKRKEDILKQQEEKYRTLVQNAKVPIYRFDKNFKRLHVNPEVEKLVGKSYSELINKTPFEVKIIEDESIENLKKAFDKVFETKQMVPVELVFILPDNKRKHFVHNLIPEFDNNGEVESIIAMSYDLTVQKEIESKEEMFRTLAENSPNIIMRYNSECMRIYANPAFARQTGIPINLIKNNKPDVQWGVYLNMLNLSALEYQNRIKKVIETGKSDNLVVEWIRSNDNKQVAHDLNIIAERDGKGKITGALAIGHNITEQKKILKKIEFMAHHDILTELPNRLLVKDRVSQSLLRAKRSSKQVALLFLDLDSFKTINDSLGHSVGDEVLRLVANRLKNCLRESDTVSRQGGDEFLVLLPDISDKKEVISVVKKLLSELNKSLYIDEQVICSSCSIGISMFPKDGQNFEELLQCSDVAMYKAKDNGKNNYYFYTQEMKHNHLESFKIQSKLKDAIKNKEFILYYQPQINLDTNEIIGVEALIRWNHPILGMVPPKDFIPIAENSGLIVEIGEWVLEEACKQAFKWNIQGKNLVVAVNISAIQFKRGNLLNTVKTVLDKSGLNPKYLELELTESILINDTENVLQTVKAIKELGVLLSIDDFGTGYSSLAYLKRFAVDKLKIDQSFVKGILDDKDDASIVKAIIEIAKNLSLKSIAEGVENQKILELIKKLGCNEVQGYHFAKPMNNIDFEKYLTDFKEKK